jgi:hypothetical protein
MIEALDGYLQARSVPLLEAYLRAQFAIEWRPSARFENLFFLGVAGVIYNFGDLFCYIL